MRIADPVWLRLALLLWWFLAVPMAWHHAAHAATLPQAKPKLRTDSGWKDTRTGVPDTHADMQLDSRNDLLAAENGTTVRTNTHESIAGDKPTASETGEKIGSIPQTSKNKNTEVSVYQERQVLRDLFVEMQKRADAKFGYSHTLDEEDNIDYYFEDDIVLTLGQAEAIVADLSPRRKRKLAEPLSKRWQLPVPYAFDGSHNEDEKWRIRMALAYWQDLTCITFQENDLAENKLLFVKGRGCWSYVGYTHQVNQTISIGDGCQSNGTIAHEVGHAIGFWHEQSRPDRDDLVLIHQYNVTAGKLYNFAKRTWGEIVTLDVPYDLGSDMHYGSKFYASDVNSSLLTVETRDPLMRRVIGQRQELSFYDVKLANKAYCDAECSSQDISLRLPCQRDGYQDPKRCHQCICPDGFTGEACETVSPGQNAYCGGALFAQFNGTIRSPGYPMRGYGAEVECSWLIKAPSGTHVFLEFYGVFGISGHVDVCKDFVEVRYNTSLSLTGARFCCDDPPRTPIKSDSNEMLVLFRSFQESRICDDVKYPWKCRLTYIGFAAKYYTQSCGGCGNYGAPEQAPCLRRLSYTCAQSWEETVRTSCSVWWYNNDCGPRVVTKVRYATCFKDELYCCDRYILQNGKCTALPSTPEQRFPDNDDSGHQMSALVASTHIERRPAVQGWSEWGPWGRCSRTCGGGVRARRKNCVVPAVCGHQQMKFQREPCGQNVCYKICQSARFELCDFWIQCKRTTYSICDKYCADSYRLEGDSCVPRHYG